MPFSEDVDNAILDHFFGRATWPSMGGNRWLGLSSTTPTKIGDNITEPSGGGYARVQLLAGDMEDAASSATENSSIKDFPTATDDWAGGANMTHLVIFDAETGGNFLASKALESAVPVLTGDTPRFNVGNLDFAIGGDA